MATIDAAPFPHELNIDDVALLSIDIQRDFCLPRGFAEPLENDIDDLAPCPSHRPLSPTLMLGLPRLRSEPGIVPVPATQTAPAD